MGEAKPFYSRIPQRATSLDQATSQGERSPGAHLLSMRTPRPQLTAEQTAIRKTGWKLPEKISCTQRLRRNHIKVVGGVLSKEKQSHTRWVGNPQTGK